MKAFIKNLINDREYQIEKDSLQELQDFIQYQKDKKRCPWGALEKELLVDPSEYPDRAELIEVVEAEEPVFDENFDLVMEEESYTDEDGLDQVRMVQVFETVTKHKVRIPQEFEILIDEVPTDKRPQYHATLRSEIERVLDQTDWLFVSDVIIAPAHRTIYRDYRALLRTEHSRDLASYVTESDFRVESFENYIKRTKPELFLEGADGQKVINKFMSKL